MAPNDVYGVLQLNAMIGKDMDRGPPGPMVDLLPILKGFTKTCYHFLKRNIRRDEQAA